MVNSMIQLFLFFIRWSGVTTVDIVALCRMNIIEAYITVACCIFVGLSIGTIAKAIIKSP